MRFLSVPAALLVAFFIVACDAGTKPNAAGGPGPRVHFASPRMDQVVPIVTEKVKEKDKDGKEIEREIQKVTVEVLFDLMNYTVGKDEAGKGQHLHLIIDNEPYLAIYDVSQATTLDPKVLTPGTHILRAFPSAGPTDAKGALEHEARKNDGAFAWVRFHVGQPGGDLASEFDPKAPMLTYSRPKGEYVVGSANHKNFMLDWYQTHVTLERGGLHVAAWLDGKRLDEFDVPAKDKDGKPTTVKEYGYRDWKRVLLPPPAVGEHVMKLQLLNRDDQPVGGPFNTTERKFTVVEKKP